MIKRIKILLFFAVAFILISFSIERNKRYRIYLKEYNYFFTPQNSCIDTITGVLEDNSFLHIDLYNCLGKMHVRIFDSNKIKIEEGDYISSLDLLKRYSNAISPRNGESQIKVYSYYQPLRSGEWSFYNSEGILQMKKKYRKGVIIDSTVFK